MATATEAATAMNRAAIAMRLADAEHTNRGCAQSRAALDEAISDYRAAADLWAAAYALEISGERLAQFRGAEVE